MANFKWNKKLQKSTPSRHRGRVYELHATGFPPNYRVDLIVNGNIELSDNTEKSSFRDLVDATKPISEQILDWGNRMVSERAKKCPKCSEEKIVDPLHDYDMERPSFAGFTELCSSCRSAIYNAEFEEERKEMEIEDDKFRKELEKNPPIIIGGFTEKEAMRFIKATGNQDIEEGEHGNAFCKGILKAKDGTYYPVFLGIDLESSGEHYGTYFIASNRDDVIDQKFVLPFLGKPKEKLFPYKYRTLAHIPGDIHQPDWPNFN